ncbi:MAG: hypothetical protein F6J93_34825 [Oscillatoria sp. SIO1A7]|nr:hypothetical protein [Oscillatoria sp. SIO1A7]
MRGCVGEGKEGLRPYTLGWEEVESENSIIDNEGWLMGILMGGKIEAATELSHPTGEANENLVHVNLTGLEACSINNNKLG